MCGIIGVLSAHEASPLLVEALKRLEYRGYDSAGIATVHEGRLDRRRAVGKLAELSDLLVREPLRGRVGIGHTRWATHGAPSVTNAHPHRAGPVAVVHNGIIENHKALREELAAKGHAVTSETDTEVVALLVQDLMAAGLGPQAAAAAALDRLEGAFALAFLFEGEEDLIVAARRGSPLAVGHGEGETFLGSDAIALAPLTDRLTYLEEGDRAHLTRAGVEIFDREGRKVTRPEKRVTIDAGQIEKGGYRHFMAKEIAEQPAVLADALAHHLGGEDEVALDVDLSGVERMTMTACGTAFYACQTAKYWVEALARLPVEADIASEFRYREPPLDTRTLSVFVSQSGETADTLAALRYCAGRSRVVSLVNAAESSIARESEAALPLLAGREIGVASTKAFTCQLAVLACLAIKAGIDRGTLDPASARERVAELRAVPGLVSRALTVEPAIREVAQELAEARDVLFLGRGPMYPLALEGALKLKEISYIHAEGYAAGELKHGPIALIDASVPVVVMAPSGPLFDKTLSNVAEVMARGGRVVLITDAAGAAAAGDGPWRVITMPPAPGPFAPIVYAIPAQLLAYHTAVAKGTDVDQPRNLAKSVTVE